MGRTAVEIGGVPCTAVLLRQVVGVGVSETLPRGGGLRILWTDHVSMCSLEWSDMTSGSPATAPLLEEACTMPAKASGRSFVRVDFASPFFIACPNLATVDPKIFVILSMSEKGG